MQVYRLQLDLVKASLLLKSGVLSYTHNNT